MVGSVVLNGTKLVATLYLWYVVYCYEIVVAMGKNNPAYTTNAKQDVLGEASYVYSLHNF